MPFRHGSSPLTRGKRSQVENHHGTNRLIPAHAGKTQWRSGSPPGKPAHPRSRGENGVQVRPWDHCAGSSPLTRGKRGTVGRTRHVPRLIPAHAGKTGPRIPRCRGRRAHPRSRGENSAGVTSPQTLAGSSPLTRGKRWHFHGGHGSHRLIPAHAGKTYFRHRTARPCRAHPRSRGENSPSRSGRLSPSGSSPLTRGKRRGGAPTGRSARLIPAHAGKTSDCTASGP